MAVTAPAVPAPAQAVVHDRVERKIVRLVNAARHRHGKGSLRLNRRMGIGAQRHSNTMARGRYLAHGASWYSRVSFYARARTVGEVVADSRAPAGRQAGWVVRAWMHSPTHRAVLLSGRFHRTGVGRRRAGGMTYFTLDTAR